MKPTTFTQILTISPGGELSGLQRKPGQGLDLTTFGRAAVERTSEIVWNDADQNWNVTILRGPRAGTTLTPEIFEAATGKTCPGALETERAADQPLAFASYDAGVAAEILFLDALRLAGEH